MRRVCFVMPNLKNGGGNRVFIEIANELAQKGRQVHLVHPVNSLDKITYKIDPRIKIVSIGKYRRSKIFQLWRLLQTIISVRLNYANDDVVISEPLMSVVFLIHRSKNLTRFVQADDYSIFDDRMIIRNKFILSFFKWLIVRTYRRKLKFVFNSQYVYDQFLKFSGRTDVPFRLVHPAINGNIFKNMNVRSWKPGTKLNLCVVARRHPWKGFIDFIDAWKKLKANLGDRVGDVYVISHDDLSEFDLSGFTLVKPDSDIDIRDYMNRSHLFISTSWWEGFGLPPLEAMSCGCACIISRSGGVLEYAKDTVNCMMYTPRDVNDLCSQLVVAFNDVALLERLSIAGEKEAAKFSWSKAASDMEVILAS